MREWVRTRLGDLVEIEHGYAFKGKYFHENPPGDLLLTPGNFEVGGGFKWGKQKYYRDGPVPEEYVLNPGDVLVTMTDLSKEADTLGYSAVVPESKVRLLHNQRLGKVVKRSEAVDLGYVHWLLRSPDYRNEILASYTGSTVKHTSPKKILAYEFLLPPLVEQREIAAALDLFDRKIELNQRMNQTLVTMARAIFKDWFVDFGPSRAKAEGRAPYLAPDLWALFPSSLDDEDKPAGWNYRPVSKFARITGGKQLAKGKFLENGLVPVFGGAGLMGYTDSHNADGYVICVGRVGAYCGQFFSHRGKAWINNNASLITPFDGVTGEWLLMALRALNVELIKKGAAQPFVSNSDIAAMDVIYPGELVLTAFTDRVRGLMLRQESSRRENATLANMRDLLLPKLISGEIRLRDTEKPVEAVA